MCFWVCCEYLPQVHTEVIPGSPHFWYEDLHHASVVAPLSQFGIQQQHGAVLYPTGW